MAEKSLYFFAKAILGYDWLNPEIHKPLCEILENYEKNTRVKVTLPRSWLKSTVCTISYPIWRAVRDANVRVLLVQNTADNARAKLRSIRGQFETNEILRTLYPHLLPTKDCRWTTGALELRRSRVNPEPTFEAAGRNTQVVGRHYNVIVEDDTVAPDKDEYTEDNVLPTKEDIGQAIGYHRAATPLLVDFNTDQILVVGTRWFEVDLLSWIGEHETWYVSYEKAVRETDGRPDPQGQLVWPQRFGEEALKRLEQSLGPYLFSCLYLNHPLRSEDMVFQKKWFHFYLTEPEGLENYITVDPAGNPKNSQAKRKRKNDYNVIMVCGKHRSGRVYILNYVRFKGSPGELLDRLFEMVAIYKPKEVGIEGIAYQESLEYFVKEQMRARKMPFNIKLLKHGGRSKEFRIRALQPIVKAEILLFKGWMRELLSELETFPLGANDDLADALSMMLQMWTITHLVDEPTLEQQDETNFGLDAAIRSLARKHRPPVASSLDVFTKFSEGADESRDPYSYLFDEESKN